MTHHDDTALDALKRAAVEYNAAGMGLSRAKLGDIEICRTLTSKSHALLAAAIRYARTLPEGQDNG